MASLEDALVPIPKKRITTYGKAVRGRRVQNFAPRIQTSEKKHNALFTPSLPPAEPKSKPPPKRPSPSATESSSGNVFDVPSTDDEATPAVTNIHKPVTKLASKTKTQKPLPSKDLSGPVSATEESGRNKRVKLSPPTKSEKSTLSTSKDLHNPFKTGHTTTMASRPKQMVPVQRKPELPNTPRKPSPSSKIVASSEPPALQNDPDMMDIDLPSSYVSPKGQQMWKELLDPVDTDGVASLATKTSSRGAGKLLSGASGITKNSQPKPKKLPRRRLIDSLVEQTKHDDDMEDVQEAESERDLGSIPTEAIMDISRSQSLVPEISLPPQLAIPSSQGPQNAGPKFTYSRQRSMLAEEDLMAQLAIDMPTQPAQTQNGRRPRRGSIPKITPLQSFHEEEDDDEGAGSKAIRNVHELRQAGANSRFMDEMEDILDQIGEPSTQPSSMRRSSLLDLASKFKDKNFARQFRANGVEQRLFVHLGQETDVIAGYIMVSILMAVLVDTSMPHIVTQLRRQGITKLLIRLLDFQTTVIALSKERKSNMSKMAQLLISKHQDFVLHLPLWEDLQPQAISPRTIALKCLELMVRQTRESGNSGDIISKELTTKLIAIFKSASDEASWELPSGQQAVDFCLALSTLESHSIAARTVHDESIWISDYLPIIADTLEVALRHPVDAFGNMQALILRLTLNVTNNNAKASDVFARESLMAVMGSVIVAKFQKILRFLTEDDFSVVVDRLVLMLGVMINFVDGSSDARESLQNLAGKENDPLENIVQLFVDNAASTAEAESMEETQKNVAFGYLSVLLGYLSLSPDIYDRIAAQQPRKSMKTLLSSIEEFIGHHKVADSQIEADDEGYNAKIGLTERLESLVAKLSAKKSESEYR